MILRFCCPHLFSGDCVTEISYDHQSLSAVHLPQDNDMMPAGDRLSYKTRSLSVRNQYILSLSIRYRMYMFVPTDLKNLA